MFLLSLFLSLIMMSFKTIAFLLANNFEGTHITNGLVL